MQKGKRTDVLVGQLMRKTNPLRLVLHRAAIHNSMLKLLLDSAVDGITLEIVSLSHYG